MGFCFRKPPSKTRYFGLRKNTVEGAVRERVAGKDGDDDDDVVAIVGVTFFVIDGALAFVVTIYDADRSTRLMGLP